MHCENKITLEKRNVFDYLRDLFRGDLYWKVERKLMEPIG
jgi:hypothetical protein